jgi:hypothetical protein
MPDDFFARTEQLMQMVGEDELVGEFRVDRVYAVVQHERGWRNYLGAYGPKSIEVYHQGGGSKFVEAPLKENYVMYFERMANGLLKGAVREEMESAMEDMHDELQVRAPERDGELKKSGNYTVTDDGNVFARREPEAPYEDEKQGNPPGGVIGLLQKAGKL